MLWSKSMMTGVKRMDHQNREMCRRIDLLLEASQNNKSRQVLDFLDDYMKRHFEDERILHRASGYPNAANHQKHHDRTIAVLHNIKEQITEHELPAANAVNEKVAGMVKEHIALHDQDFAQYLKTMF